MQASECGNTHAQILAYRHCGQAWFTLPHMHLRHARGCWELLILHGATDSWIIFPLTKNLSQNVVLHLAKTPWWSVHGELRPHHHITPWEHTKQRSRSEVTWWQHDLHWCTTKLFSSAFARRRDTLLFLFAFFKSAVIVEKAFFEAVWFRLHDNDRRTGQQWDGSSSNTERNRQMALHPVWKRLLVRETLKRSLEPVWTSENLKTDTANTWWSLFQKPSTHTFGANLWARPMKQTPTHHRSLHPVPLPRLLPLLVYPLLSPLHRSLLSCPPLLLGKQKTAPPRSAPFSPGWGPCAWVYLPPSYQDSRPPAGHSSFRRLLSPQGMTGAAPALLLHSTTLFPC